MSHRIIINNKPFGTATAGDPPLGHSSLAFYEFEFVPSHHLTEQEQNRRIAKIRRVLDKLATDVTASGESAD